MDDIIIERVGFTNRTYNCLKKNNINTLDEVMHLYEEDLTSISGMGKKSVNEVLNFQKKYLIDPSAVFDNLGPDVTQQKDRMQPQLDLSVLMNAIPAIYQKEIVLLAFSTEYGTFMTNPMLEDTSFSKKILNPIKKANIHTIKEFSELRFSDLIDIGKFGKKKLSEIMDYYQNNTLYLLKPVSLAGNTSSMVEYISDEFQNNDRYENNVLYSILISLINNYFENEDVEIENKSIILQNILNTKEAYKCIGYFITGYLLNETISLEKSRIYALIPSVVSENIMWGNLYEELVSNHQIYVHGQMVSIFRPNVNQWINSIKDELRQFILKGRISGKKFEEIGAEIGCTRQRTQQLQSDIFKTKPTLKEDQYAVLYEKYIFDEESFCYIFDEPKETYGYLNLQCSKGKTDLIEILNDELLNKEQYTRAIEYIGRNDLWVYDKKVSPTRYSIAIEILKNRYATKSVSVSEFYAEYNRVLQLNDNVDKKLFFSNERAAEAWLDRTNCLIKSAHAYLRYYIKQDYDYDRLVSLLSLNDYMNKEISTKILFENHADIMEEYNILDFHELHFALKNFTPYSSAIHMTKSPLLSIGDANRDQQVIDFLKEVSPISVNDLAFSYEEEYGINHKTFIANYCKCIDKYHQYGKYVVPTKEVPQDVKAFLKGYLKDNFYFVEDIREIIYNKFDKESVDLLHAATFKELGYNWKVSYIVSNKYTNTTEMFKDYFRSFDTIKLNQMDSRIKNLPRAYDALSSMKYDGELIEFNESVLVKSDYFYSVIDDVTPEDISDFVKSVEEYSLKMDYFTVTSLINDGFYHKILDSSMSSYFLSAVLKNSRKFGFIRINNAYLYTSSKEAASIVKFCEYIMCEKRKILIDEFVDDVKENYGVSINIDKLKLIINNSSMYYDSIMDKIYIDKNEYFNEF